MLADILIIAIIAVIFIFCLRKLITGMKHGGCEGCGGSCSGCCHQCGASNPDTKK